MKVKELINILSKEFPDNDVVVDTSAEEPFYRDIGEITNLKVTTTETWTIIKLESN